MSSTPFHEIGVDDAGGGDADIVAVEPIAPEGIIAVHREGDAG